MEERRADMGVHDGVAGGCGPAGARPTSGVVHKRSPLSVAETVERLATAIRAAGATLFLVVDHSGEAQRVGMVPLKVLVWMDDDGVVWKSYLDAGWLAARRGLAAELAVPLSAVDRLTAQVAT
jgi:uncharacterized protein (DUF302 family)